MLQTGDQVPHFAVTAIDGSRATYSEIWQRRSLVLVCLPRDPAAGASGYAAGLLQHVTDIRSLEADCVITPGPIPGIPCPGVVVADRWGEIYFVAGVSKDAALPSPGEVLEWLKYIANECPECQGETR